MFRKVLEVKFNQCWKSSYTENKIQLKTHYGGIPLRKCSKKKACCKNEEDTAVNGEVVYEIIGDEGGHSIVVVEPGRDVQTSLTPTF